MSPMTVLDLLIFNAAGFVAGFALGAWYVRREVHSHFRSRQGKRSR